MKVIILFLIFFSNPVFAQDKINPTEQKDILKKMIAFYENIKDFSANFDQVLNQKKPERIFKKKGQVFLKKPLLMRWDYKEPDEVYYISDGKVFYCYQVEDKIIYRMNINNSELYASFKFMISPSAIEEDFKISKGEKGTDGLVQLILEPKKFNGNYQKILLFLEEKSSKIKKTIIIDHLDNENIFNFENESYKELPAQYFNFTPPKGLKVQDL